MICLHMVHEQCHQAWLACYLSLNLCLWSAILPFRLVPILGPLAVQDLGYSGFSLLHGNQKCSMNLAAPGRPLLCIWVHMSIFGWMHTYTDQKQGFIQKILELFFVWAIPTYTFRPPPMKHCSRKSERWLLGQAPARGR